MSIKTNSATLTKSVSTSDNSQTSTVSCKEKQDTSLNSTRALMTKCRISCERQSQKKLLPFFLLSISISLNRKNQTLLQHHMQCGLFWFNGSHAFNQIPLMWLDIASTFLHVRYSSNQLLDPPQKVKLSDLSRPKLSFKLLRSFFRAEKYQQ